MVKLRVIISTGVIGALIGAVIAEVFPRLFNPGIAETVGSALNGVFSPYRNELALKYGFWGLLIGLAVGLVLSLTAGSRSED